MILVSILGDSISTYEGFNPPGYAVFYDKTMQERNGMYSVYDTWWAKVNQALHAYLCVNNSYSGSMVSGISFPSGVSNERLSNLRTEKYIPDYIFIYLGFNDFGRGIRITSDNKRMSFPPNPEFFEDAYDIMLKTVKSYNPMSKIVCGTLIRTKIKGKTEWDFPEKYAGIEFEDYNNVIRYTSQKNGCYLADVGLSGVRYETLDGSHPTKDGHITIAESWIRCLTELDLIKPATETI